MENVWISVFRADIKRITRDRFLLLIATYLPIMAIAFRWVIPALAEAVKDSVDIRPYYPVVCAIVVLILPYMMGCVLGLQLLEEKDEGSLNAVVVTPFSFRRYFLFRAVMYAAIGAVMLVVVHVFMGIVHTVSLFQLCVIAAAMSLNTGLSAFIVAILAKNQVQGFAVLKGSGIFFIIPVLSFFIPPHLDLLVGVLPFYWPVKAYYLAVSGGAAGFFWLAIGIAFSTQIIALAFLYRIFMRSVVRV